VTVMALMSLDLIL